MARTQTAWSGVAFGLATAALAAYQLFKLPPVLPLMIELYGYERVLAGALMSVFALAGLAFSLPVGAAVGRLGARRLVLAACVLFLAGEGLTLAWAESGLAVLAARALEGVGFTICAVVGPLIANLNASRRRLPLVIGLTAAWIPIGQVTASLLALPLVGAGAWRPLWWLGAGLTLALAVAALAVGRGRAMLMPPTAAVGRAAPMARDERRALIVGGAVFGLWSGQYFGYMTWLPQYLVEVHGLDEALAAFAYTLPVAALLVFNVLTGLALTAGAPLTALFVGSIAVQVVAWFVVPVVGTGALGTVALLAYGITAGITPVCLFAMPSAVMGPGRLDAGAFGIVMTGRNLGVLAGPVLLAAIVEAGGWSWVWPAFGAATLAAGLGAADVGRRLARLRRD